ncbi:hypothetical protein FOCC_FOCC013927 [Frankliniella occidentalis]|nr:hypothetical protein FOCC_FOCC013927 [Frankliniella occidentalis]
MLEEIDREIKRVSKAALHLPQRASPEIVFLPTYQGGANILPLMDMADVTAVVHAFRLLTSPDPAVTNIAEASLKRTVSKYYQITATWDDAATYLNGDNPRNTNAFATIWSHARSATVRLNSMIPGLRWSWCEDRQTICIEWPTPDNRQDRAVVEAESRKVLQPSLRRELQKFYNKKLLRKPDQGKVARLGVLPLNGCLRIKDRTRTCRRCQYPEETTAHVLCHCQMHSRAWINTHKSVIKNITDNMKSTENLRVERAVPEADSRLMPDLVVINNERKLAVIIDVACPFDARREALIAKRKEKIDKYTPLCNTLKAKGYRAIVDAIIVGSLGSWDPANFQALNLLGVPKQNREHMIRKTISDVIRWSRDFYVEHLCGHRQYSKDVQLEL